MINLAPSRNRIRKLTQQQPTPPVEIRVIVEIQMPEWMQQMQQQHSQRLQEAPEVQTQVIHTIAQIPPPDEPTVTTTTVAPKSTAIRVESKSPSLVDLYEDLLAKKERLTNEPKSVRDDLRFIADFEVWLMNPESAPRIITPRGALAKTLELSDTLASWARMLRAKSVGGSVGQTMKKMNALSKLAKACHAAGLIDKAAKAPTAGDLQLMIPVAESENDDSEDMQGEPVTIEEFKRMIAACREDVWPYFPSYWEIKLTGSYYAGIRLQDWFAELSKEKKGLLWQGVMTDPKCPRLEDLHHGPGWLWYLVHKTKKKDARRKRNPRNLIPNSSWLSQKMEPYRSLDPERVFPVTCNKRSSSREFHAILKRSGLDDLTRLHAGKPIIRISEGKTVTWVRMKSSDASPLQQKTRPALDRNGDAIAGMVDVHAPMCSFRKGCADMWTEHVGAEAASYMLKHAITDSQVSATTRNHYLQVYRPLRLIVPAVEGLPLWQPS